MNTEKHGYKECKCNRCGWVHAALPLPVVQQNPDYAGYHKCFKCGAPSDGFVPAHAKDAPTGSTIQGVYVPGAWEC
jgi:hypothetical protein